MVFSDLNKDGCIQPFNEDCGAVPTTPDGTPIYSEILQENHYYPFGMQMEGPWQEVISAPENDYTYNGKELNEDFGLDWLDYGARWYDPSIGRFPSTDRFAEKYYSMTPYQYGANNPVVNIDINGDSVSYANDNIEAYVDKYASPTRTTRKGKIKKNKNYNPAFAALIKTLKGADKMFNFTDDASLISGESTVGQVTSEGDGHNFNIIVPDHKSGSKKGELQELMGGRGNLLAEETFHGTQIANGDIKAKGKGFVKGTSTVIAAEVDAKIFAAGSGMSKLSSSKILPGYSVPTMAGIIKDAKGDRMQVLRIITKGTTKQAHSNNGSGTSTITYPGTYRLFGN